MSPRRLRNNTGTAVPALPPSCLSAPSFQVAFLLKMFICSNYFLSSQCFPLLPNLSPLLPQCSLQISIPLGNIIAFQNSEVVRDLSFVKTHHCWKLLSSNSHGLHSDSQLCRNNVYVCVCVTLHSEHLA